MLSKTWVWIFYMIANLITIPNLSKHFFLWFMIFIHFHL